MGVYDKFIFWRQILIAFYFTIVKTFSKIALGSVVAATCLVFSFPEPLRKSRQDSARESTTLTVEIRSTKNTSCWGSDTRWVGECSTNDSRVAVHHPSRPSAITSACATAILKLDCKNNRFGFTRGFIDLERILGLGCWGQDMIAALQGYSLRIRAFRSESDQAVQAQELLKRVKIALKRPPPRPPHLR